MTSLSVVCLVASNKISLYVCTYLCTKLWQLPFAKTTNNFQALLNHRANTCFYFCLNATNVNVWIIPNYGIFERIRYLYNKCSFSERRVCQLQFRKELVLLLKQFSFLKRSSFSLTNQLVEAVSTVNVFLLATFISGTTAIHRITFPWTTFPQNNDVSPNNFSPNDISPNDP
jgi:hypothetical protein